MATQTAIKTSPFILSFPALFEPTANMEGRLAYRAEMMFPKTLPEAAFRPIYDLYVATIPDTWKKGSPNPQLWRSPSGWAVKPVGYIDGDTKRQEERHGHWILRATSGVDYPPRVLLSERDPLDGRFVAGDAKSVYAGCWCVAVLTAYAFDHEKGNAGVAFNLHTVQKVGDGTPFSRMLSDDEAERLLG